MATLTKRVSNPEQNKVTYYSPEKYLALEEKAEFKSKYRNGEAITMAGGTINHNRIISNLFNCT